MQTTRNHPRCNTQLDPSTTSSQASSSFSSSSSSYLKAAQINPRDVVKVSVFGRLPQQFAGKSNYPSGARYNNNTSRLHTQTQSNDGLIYDEHYEKRLAISRHFMTAFTRLNPEMAISLKDDVLTFLGGPTDINGDGSDASVNSRWLITSQIITDHNNIITTSSQNHHHNITSIVIIITFTQHHHDYVHPTGTCTA